MKLTFAQADRNSKTVYHLLISLALAAFAGLAIPISQTNAQEPGQISFATPDEAATALLQALKTDDIGKLQAIFGADAQQAFSSGDPILDRRDREVIAVAMQQSRRWAPKGANKQELMIGDEVWPFPVPLVKRGNSWQFDTNAGKAEVLARRVGRNELAVIELCRAYVLAQREYASQAHDGKPAGLYAQKFRSTSGQQDGLFWSVKSGEPPSPLGDLAAEAAVEGYDREKSQSAPFWGYHFRSITRQGKSAPGGAKSYLVNGDMTGGFALIAYPAKHKHSGVMTFIVNQDGVVFERDLGVETTRIASEMKEYDPIKSWRKVH